MDKRIFMSKVGLSLANTIATNDTGDTIRIRKGNILYCEPYWHPDVEANIDALIASWNSAENIEATGA